MRSMEIKSELFDAFFALTNFPQKIGEIHWSSRGFREQKNRMSFASRGFVVVAIQVKTSARKRTELVYSADDFY